MIRHATRRIGSYSLSLCVGAAAVHAAMTGDKPTITVPRLDQKPTLEDFLDMRPSPPFADGMAVVQGGFIQREPVDGDPASQRTDVYLGYDADSLYAVFVAFDTEPAKIRANMTRRETFLGDDTVEIQLDTFRDERRAYTFLCNPLGVQFDAVWTEGREFDMAFDTVWQSRGALTDRGYVVWMAIPFKSLRFPESPGQSWGIILNRDVPRNNEQSFWPQYTNRIQGRLNQAGVLEGLHQISPPRNVQIIPYATSRSFRISDASSSPGSPELVRRADTDAGVDAKFVVHDSLVVDVTANPDFSQVESDEPQVTVNRRFEAFFPEKRPFFLENAGYFQSPINLLFTRRIQDPRVGGRLTGKTGPWSLGALVIDDDSAGLSVNPTHPAAGDRAQIGVLRASRDVLEQSNLGLLVTDREFGKGFNRVGGFDGRLKFDDHWNAFYQAVTSSTRRYREESLPDGSTRSTLESLSGAAYEGALNRTGRHFRLHLHGIDIAPGFVSELGFVPRTDVRDLHQEAGYTFRPEGKRLLNWTPSLFAGRIEDHDGTRLDWRLKPELRFEFRRQTAVELSASTGDDLLRPGDARGVQRNLVFPVSEYALEVNSRFSQRFGFKASLAAGQTINLVQPEGSEPVSADSVQGALELTFRPLDRLRIDTTYLLSRLEDHGTGAWILTDQITRAKFSLQFDLRSSLRVIGEWDNLRVDPTRTSEQDSERLNVDLLFSYLLNPWTAIYAGYNTNYASPAAGAGGSTGDFVQDARQVFVKVSYLFRP